MRPIPRERIEEAIRLRREERLSLKEIASILGVSKASCSHWIRNDPLSADEIKKKHLGCRLYPPQRERSIPASERNRVGFRVTEYNGEVAMLKVQLRATDKHVTVSRPTIPARYDAILDIDAKLVRVQVKYCNAMATDGSYSVGLERREKVYKAGEIDAVLVYIPETDKVYWLPASCCFGKRQLVLRVRPPRNGQRKCRMARDFEW